MEVIVCVFFSFIFSSSLCFWLLEYKYKRCSHYSYILSSSYLSFNWRFYFRIIYSLPKSLQFNENFYVICGWLRFRRNSFVLDALLDDFIFYCYTDEVRVNIKFFFHSWTNIMMHQLFVIIPPKNIMNGLCFRKIFICVIIGFFLNEFKLQTKNCLGSWYNNVMDGYNVFGYCYDMIDGFSSIIFNECVI